MKEFLFLKIISIKLLLLFLILLQGCATIIDGSKQEIFFSSEPAGATILVDGIEVGKTPTTFSLDRKKGASFFGFASVNIEIKKEGYHSEKGYLGGTTNPTYFGNAIFLGFSSVGSSVDLLSGSAWEYDENKFYATLTPISGSNTVENTLRNEIKVYIIISYKFLMDDISKRNGDYLNSLISMLKIKDEDKEDSIKKMQQLSELYSEIPEFAEQVADYFLKDGEK